MYNFAMKLRTTLNLMALLAGLVLMSCKTDSQLADVRPPGGQVVVETLASTAQSRSTDRTPTIPPDLAHLEEQIDSLSTAAPAQVELSQVERAAPAEVCSPLAGIELAEITQIISSAYAPPPPGKEDRHHGIDFSYYRRGEQASIQGTGVQALLPGEVAMALEGSFPYGNVIVVESSLALIPAGSIPFLEFREGESLYTLYAHLEKAPQMRAGQALAACQLLGTVGKSGNAGVAHLHLETRLGPAGIKFDRMGFYLAESTEIEKENYLRWRIGGEFRHFNPLVLLAPQTLP